METRARRKFYPGRETDPTSRPGHVDMSLRQGAFEEILAPHDGSIRHDQVGETGQRALTPRAKTRNPKGQVCRPRLPDSISGARETEAVQGGTKQQDLACHGPMPRSGPTGCSVSTPGMGPESAAWRENRGHPGPFHPHPGVGGVSTPRRPNATPGGEFRWGFQTGRRASAQGLSAVDRTP
jgi:hypothetical protein